MSDHDILSDAEQEALRELMFEPELPPQRVLIVDDDKDARELLADILGLDGIDCVTAASGEEALRMLMPDTDNRRRIGLVITDLRMGNVGGLELIRRVRESERAALPIIIVSGDASVKDAIAAMHLSVVDFLLKPIDTAKLLGLVKHELGIEPWV
ncbi:MULTISPECIES: response regulator [unclassified Pseudomonas]|jgi:DNA-binding NtrC family response regulator|uniref:response regulator n=1 Tax=Pseudomonas TaxID=286 RepID=UPI000E66F87B|nr:MULTISPECIES: response regulator [unclassified Pseudomonas]RIJ11046.1 response regulator [Pseudomonas sp. 91RF]UWI61500.1 response regulator [Pseudomonas sp. BW7P1]